jgi:hypothetical protein
LLAEEENYFLPCLYALPSHDSAPGAALPRGG